jgi:hypothetical protein
VREFAVLLISQCSLICKCPMRGKLDYECGSEFIDENGGGPGVRLRKGHQKKS